jgi:uncharacterized membrane protein YsdA (DUF1294 family)
MSLLIPLVAALVFACERPKHHDGDAIRCMGQTRSMRMHGIDAPEMPGSCRPGRKCTPGDPFAARDYLTSLTVGRAVRCQEKDVDRYGRVVVRCVADDLDLGCAMVEAGHAVERYGRLDCDKGIQVAAVDPPAAELEAIEPPALQPTPELTPPVVRETDGTKRYFAPPEAETGSELPPWVLPVALLLVLSINLLGFALMANDRAFVRSPPVVQRRRRRLPESILLLVAIAGGGIGMLAVQLMYGHKVIDVVFSRSLLLLTGLWFGVLAGGLLLLIG